MATIAERKNKSVLSDKISIVKYTIVPLLVFASMHETGVVSIFFFLRDLDIIVLSAHCH